MSYFVIWAIIVLFSFMEAFSAWRYEKSAGRAIVIIGLGILLTLFAGLRFDVGYDYDGYKDIWYGVGASGTILNLMVEPFFAILVVLVYKILGHYEWLILLTACIAIPWKIRFMRKYAVFPFMAILLYFSRVFLIFDMGQIRQGVAFVFILYSVLAIIKRNAPLFYLLIICGALFHISALSFIPAYYLARKRIPSVVAIVTLTICIAFALVDFKVIIGGLLSGLPDFIQNKLLYYGSTESSVGLTFAMFFRILIVILFLLARPRIEAEDKNANIFFNIYFIGVCIYFMFNSFPQIAGRVSAYFLLFEVILVPMIMYIANDRWIKLGVYSFLIVYSFWGVLSTIQSNDNSFLPYKSILGH